MAGEIYVVPDNEMALRDNPTQMLAKMGAAIQSQRGPVYSPFPAGTPTIQRQQLDENARQANMVNARVLSGGGGGGGSPLSVSANQLLSNKYQKPEHYSGSATQKAIEFIFNGTGEVPGSGGYRNYNDFISYINKNNDSLLGAGVDINAIIAAGRQYFGL